jgi:hypothetical protein
MPRVLLFASELAAFVGANPYQKPATALLEVFRRTYADRAARLNVRSREEKFEALVEKTGTRAVISQSVAAASEATERDDVGGVTAQVSAVTRALDSDTTLTSTDRAALKRDAVSSMQTHFGTVQETRGVAVLEKASMLTKSVAAVDEEFASLERDILSQGASAAPIAEILPQLRVEAMEAVAQSLSDPKLDSLSAGAVQTEAMQALPRAAVAAVLEQKAGALLDRAGVSKSAPARANFERSSGEGVQRLRGAFRGAARASKVEKRDNKWRHRAVGTIDAVPEWARDVEGAVASGRRSSTAIDVVVGGRIDGWSPEHGLVEIKNRMRRLFPKIPLYETVQVHAYMWILGGGRRRDAGAAGSDTLSHAMLVQRLKKDHAVSSSHRIEWDAQLWQRSVVDVALRNAKVMHTFAHDEELLAHFAALGGVAAREEALIAEQIAFASEDSSGADIFAC